MTSDGLFALLAAFSASLLGGLAVAYCRFVWTHGNGLRRFMRWLAPIWALVAFYHAAIWVADAFNPDINTVPLLRPAGWLAFLIPAFTLLGALIEDTAHRDEERRAEKQLKQIAERLGRG